LFFSHRDGGPPDDFARDAIRFFRERQQRGEPLDEPYFRFVDDFQGESAHRYATQRIMLKDCVVCHNERAESTKRDWKVGDVGGVLEIIRHVRGDQTLSLRGTFFMVTSISGSLLGLCILSVVVESRRRFRVTPPR